MAGLSVVIVNWNVRVLLDKCLFSLRRAAAALPGSRKIRVCAKRARARIRPSMRVSVLLSFFLLSFAAHAQRATVIEHAVLIDGSGGAPLHDAALLLENGRIARIAPSG